MRVSFHLHQAVKGMFIKFYLKQLRVPIDLSAKVMYLIDLLIGPFRVDMGLALSC